MLPLPAALVNSVSAFDKIIPHLRKTLSQKTAAMRCMATVTDRLYIFCLFLPFILVCAKEMREQQQKSQQHPIVQNTDRQPPLFLSLIKRSPNACGEYAVFTTETSRFFSYTSIISQSISKNRRFLIAFRKTTRAFQKTGIFLIAFCKTQKVFQKSGRFLYL